MAAARPASRDMAAEVAFLTRALKAPALRESAGRLADRARAESWTHEEFLIACLQREVSARESHGGEGRIRAARFPARKSLEDFDYDHARGLKREVIAHLGTLDFVTARDNAVFLGPPGTGKTHLATGLAIRACQAGHRVAFATAAQWVARLAEAHHAGRLQAELTRLFQQLRHQAFLVLLELVRQRYDFLAHKFLGRLPDQLLVVVQVRGCENIFGPAGFHQKAAASRCRARHRGGGHVIPPRLPFAQFASPNRTRPPPI